MKLYSKNELKSSRIFFDKQPPMFFTILILSILVILIGSLWICTLVSKNYIVEAQGTITTEDNTYVGALTDGVVLDIKEKEGASVKKGDVLFIISNGGEGVQLQGLLKQKKQTNEKLNAMELYDKSLNSGSNYLMNSGYEQEYYGKMEYYLSLVSEENNSSSNQRDEIVKREVKLKSKKDEVSSLKAELNKLKEEVNKNKEPKQVENNADPNDNDSNRLNDADPNDDDSNGVNDADNSSKIEELKSKIETMESEIESLDTEVTQSKQQLSTGSQANQTKLQLLSELGTAKSTIKTTLVELEGQINTYKKQDSLYEVKANQNGYVHFLTTMKNGMKIQKAQTVAEISENKESNMIVEAYIQATDRSKVSVGNAVKVAIQGVNSQKYGTLTGKLVQIDQGTLTQESKDGNVILYKCEVSIQKKELSSSDGEVIKAIKSMPVIARIVYEKETYMDWILSMLNFKM